MTRLPILLATLLLLGPLPGNLSAGPEIVTIKELPYFIDEPVLVYDCDIAGSFKYSKVFTDDFVPMDGAGARGPSEVIDEEGCLYGVGLTTKFKLKAFIVQQGDCLVRISYGECVLPDKDNKPYKYKAYWFESDGGHSFPDFCEVYSECPKVVDSVCDGIVMKKDVRTREPVMSSYDYGKKFYRNIFEADDNSYQWPSELKVLGYDYGGDMTKCRIQTTFPPTAAPFKYLNFFDNERGADPIPRQTRMGYICAPKSLCGPFFSYCLTTDGYTMEYPSLYDIQVEPDLSIYCSNDSDREARVDGWPYGYDFACINACVKYRLNTMLTTNANLFDPVYGGGGGYSATEAYTSSGEGRTNNYCDIYPQNLNYGVLMAALYLESKGYEFNYYNVRCAINQALGLPTID